MKLMIHLLMLFLIATVFFSCTNRSNNTGGGHYVIASLRGPSSLGMLYFIDSLNNISDATFKIEILNEPLQARKMMLDGCADFAILPTTMAALLYNKNLDYPLTAISTWGTLYLCGNDTIVNTWNELKNNKIYLMARNMTPDVLFRHLMIENGLEPYNDVALDYRFPSHIALANAATAEIAPLCVLSEPYLSVAMQKNPNLHVLMNLHDEWTKIHNFEMPETALVCKSDLVKNDAQLIDNVIDIYKKSVNKVNKNLNEAASLAVKYQIVSDTASAKTAIRRSNLKVVRANDCKSLIISYLDVFYKMDSSIIGGKMPNETFY